MRIKIKNTTQFIEVYNSRVATPLAINTDILDCFFQWYGYPQADKIYPESFQKIIIDWLCKPTKENLSKQISASKKKMKFFVHEEEIAEVSQTFLQSGILLRLDQDTRLSIAHENWQIFSKSADSQTLYIQPKSTIHLLNLEDLVYDFIELQQPLQNVDITRFISYYGFPFFSSKFPLSDKNDFFSNFTVAHRDVLDLFLLREKNRGFPDLDNQMLFRGSMLSLDRYKFLLEEANQFKRKLYRKVKTPSLLFETYPSLYSLILDRVFFRRWQRCRYEKCGRWFMPQRQGATCCCPRHSDNYRKSKKP